MKKIMFLILIIFSINVYADSCSNDELKRLKALAEQVEFRTDYELKSNGSITYAEFSVTAYNLHEDLKVLNVYDYYKGDYLEFKYNDTKEYTLNRFVEGQKVKISFYAYTDNACSGKMILTKTLTMPYYNEYYSNDFCSDKLDFEYCVPIVEKKPTLTEYATALENYEGNNQNNNQNNETNKQNITIYIIIAIIVIIIISTLIIIIRKRIKKNSI